MKKRGRGKVSTSMYGNIERELERLRAREQKKEIIHVLTGEERCLKNEDVILLVVGAEVEREIT